MNTITTETIPSWKEMEDLFIQSQNLKEAPVRASSPDEIKIALIRKRIALGRAILKVHQSTNCGKRDAIIMYMASEMRAGRYVENYFAISQHLRISQIHIPETTGLTSYDAGEIGPNKYREYSIKMKEFHSNIGGNISEWSKNLLLTIEFNSTPEDVGICMMLDEY